MPLLYPALRVPVRPPQLDSLLRKVDRIEDKIDLTLNAVLGLANDKDKYPALFFLVPVPKSHAICLTLSKPIFFVSLAAPLNKANASVGMVV